MPRQRIHAISLRKHDFHPLVGTTSRNVFFISSRAAEKARTTLRDGRTKRRITLERGSTRRVT